MRYLNLEEVIYIYTEIIQRTGGRAGIADETMLDDVLMKPLVTFEGEELYPDIFTKVSVLLYATINNRPFVDGNKRTAIACVLFILRSNGYKVLVLQDDLIELALGTESGRYHVDYLVNWFRKNTIPV